MATAETSDHGVLRRAGCIQSCTKLQTSRLALLAFGLFYFPLSDGEGICEAQPEVKHTSGASRLCVRLSARSENLTTALLLLCSLGQLGVVVQNAMQHHIMIVISPHGNLPKILALC